jgi:hypothetical protein
MPKIEDVDLGPDHDLGVVRTMPEFRAGLAAAALDETARRTLVDQAAILIDDLYVHLPLKQAMHAVDPLQRLRLLRHRLPRLSDAQFHAELLATFIGLRDLHTNYVLPAGYQGFAFLGILVERYTADDGPRWIVTRVFPHLVGDAGLVVGAEITHWNGMPMGLAVDRNADREGGSNQAARRARGLENMTFRPVRMSLPPDEDWVDLTCTTGGETHETRLAWRVFDSVDEILAGATRGGPVAVAADHALLLGVDVRTELVRRAKRALFAPESLVEERRVKRSRAAAPRPTAAQEQAGVVPTFRPDELLARTVDTDHGTIGHLRIFTFSMQDGDIGAFIAEVRRLLALMPRTGLVVDVRGNGGGYVFAAEAILQFFSPRPIRTEPMQFICTDATADLCRAVPFFGAWSASIEESIETGATFSSALPLFDPADVNDVGQLYHGPVVLVTDALCYSATDIFAGGMQDHGIATVLGVDDNTGAGGANVLEHAQLAGLWPAGPLRGLPGGAEMRVSLRRSLRVGAREGQPVEDLGVVPDVVRPLSRDDLLHGNVDLIAFAAELLATGVARRLDVELRPAPAGRARLAITTAELTGVDVYVDGRPATTADVSGGTAEVEVAAPAGATVRLEGFDGGELVASRLLTMA